jgi:threonyl-tRNA synthetase
MSEQKMDINDHRSLGTKLKLFMFDDSTPGMPFWQPNGSKLRRRLEDILYKSHKLRGYEPVQTPAMMESDMWKVSGHYQNYRENMFPSEVEKREYLLKPMNCPMHVMLYKSDVRSYNHLPMRYFEFGQVHRNELSGALHGLFRVREFTQDDAHIFCTPEQVESEIIEVIDFVSSLMSHFDFEYKVEVSTKPEKAIGSDEIWETAESSIEEALKSIGYPYSINEGDGAFYGPKIDIKIKDNHGREWQLGTVQLDFNLPERFDMSYIGEDGDKHTPVMIHRAILGSFERFIGILLEHYNGLLPYEISPNQVAFVPVSSDNESQIEYIEKIRVCLLNHGFDSVVYDSNDTMNKRIKMAEQDKNPIVAIIGDKEVEESTVALRDKVRQERRVDDLTEFLVNLEKDMKVTI